ncbi:cob(II)yrinic acid a,c-diamide reductase [Kushneria avicenniae]|uniref:Cob(II)yrinic acid a,c-diamide reductase n=1 Tax=Kushneria avicenniae TaxID=402385 RepID=A0A1I1FPR3_9GAMM|nr:5,6-dimethylbenzimidazole synthase [Kushneria avicenniae]SFC00996.1 cob(II)yrinic acid a,c-diamide reductase [Kushneria avicenniae]
MSQQGYSHAEREAIYRTIRERRDMRHFLPDPVDQDVIRRMLEAAHNAPSVGYMQPWRFVCIRDPDLREAMAQLVDDERHATAQALDERGQAFLELKVEGIRECPELWVVALCEAREQYVFGRRTINEMDLASASCAIQNLWLAGRAEGIGVGWVSLFDPDALGALINAPEGAWPIAILCMGHVEAFYDAPMLAQQGWDQRRSLMSLIGTDGWPE